MSDTTRKPLVAGNWKLHKTMAEGVELADALLKALPAERTAEVAIAPVFTSLATVGHRLQGSSVALACQDLYWETQGAFTGEVGPLQVKELGCRYAIVGHSERRQYFGDTDDVVGKKAAGALAHDIAPIICVGESLAVREAGQAEAHVVAQVTAALAGLETSTLGQVVIAYEPIWAIGTGRTASPEDAEQMHLAIRTRVGEAHGKALADGLRILYGGSVKPGNAAELMAQPDIDGALVGGASLEAASFAAIVTAAG